MGHFFKDKKVLIIGGTGTIGQSLLNYILNEQPSVVRVFSRDEHKQHELQQKMKDRVNIRYLIGDVRDADRVLRAMQGIDYVFHVAAMKHVPFCEYNPYEAVQTNIIGTQNVIQGSVSAGVKKTIFTSTDKAIAPTNTYGASKLMAERLITTAQYNSGSHSTTFAAVRFGNVLGSRGSVVPLFVKQIKQDQMITITDPTMSRFMMTLKQATLLTIKAMEKAAGGETFVLKMPVINLEDLASVVIELTSLKYNLSEKDIRINQIGLRPGEKMFEELLTDFEAIDAIELEDMYIIPNQYLNDTKRPKSVGRKSLTSYNSHQQTPVPRDIVLNMVSEYINSNM